MASSFERNDRKRPGGERFSPGGRGRPGGFKSQPDKDGSEWLWGWHAVVAALSNPNRPKAKRILATADRAKTLTEQFGALAGLQIVEGAQIAAQIGSSNAVHQGVALKGPPIESLSLDELGESGAGFLLMMDQVTDPQNVGAIFRSAAAFGAGGVILQDRRAPALSGALAKAAAGAIDKIPHARVTNLSRALEQLAEMGWRAVGLDGSAAASLADVLDDRPTVLVLGSEGDGLRRLVAEHCDALGKSPMPGGFESLNVSAAAAVALYETSTRRTARSTS